MTTMICPNCKAEIEANSKFCNHCGFRIPEERIVCAACGKDMPANSAFCPSCGNPVNIESVTTPFEPQPEQEQEPIATAQAPAEDTDYWDATDSEESKRRHKKKLVWTLIVLLFLIVIGGYFYFSFGDSNESDMVENNTIAVPLTNDEAFDIFKNALNTHNMLGDCATPTYAIEVSPTKQNAQQVIGLSFLSNSSGRSFYKIYRLVSDSISWNITNVLTKNFENCMLNFNVNEIVGAYKEMPQFVTISDKSYFYFTYMVLPAVINSNSQGKMLFCLFDIDSEKLTTLEYEGEIVDDNGVKKIKGSATNSSKTAESQFLHSQAEAANGIYHLSPEELELEKAENSAQKWAIENANNLKRLRSGEVDVRMKITLYDKPIFSISSVAEDAQIENENLIIVTTENGTVYGYSKTRRLYFVVYAPAAGTTTTRVSFNPDGTIFINSVAIKYNFNPRDCTASIAEDFD